MGDEDLLTERRFMAAVAVALFLVGAAIGWTVRANRAPHITPAPSATPTPAPRATSAAPTADRMPAMIAATRDATCKAAAVEAIIVECVRRCRAPNP